MSAVSQFFATFISLGLVFFGGVAFVFSRRESRVYEKIARSATFHCLHCDSVYTADSDSESQPCPKCGYKNPKLKF